MQYQINLEKGRQEWLVTTRAGRPTVGKAECYGTGLDISATDAMTYILQLENWRNWARHVGSGTIGSPVLTALDSTSGMQVIFYLASPGEGAHQAAVETAQPASPANVVEKVRETFALTIRDAADVFQVSRPTIYQWLKLDSMEAVRSHRDRERMKKLYGIANAWAAKPQLHGRWDQFVLQSGETVIDLLKKDPLDIAELLNAHAVLQQHQGILENQERVSVLKAAGAMKSSLSAMEANRPMKQLTEGD